ncbi:hypothetical protein QFZ66_005483 [Streptomyces sp. B4I13]|nr:hypothetical protein [Streptomyces sp. B4I13]
MRDAGDGAHPLSVHSLCIEGGVGVRGADRVWSGRSPVEAKNAAAAP